MSPSWGPLHPLFQSTLKLDRDLIAYPWTSEQWEKAVLPPYEVFHLCEGDKLQGFALWHLSEIEKLAHLLKIAVTLELRSTGKSEDFWNRQIVTLRARGFDRVYLEVAANNGPAIGFYRKIGFRMLRKVKGFYKDGESAWTMELAI